MAVLPSDTRTQCDTSESKLTVSDPVVQTSHGESQNVGSGTTIDTDTTRATVWGSWVKFDFVKKEQEDLEKAGITGNRYVAKWLKQPFIKEMCANPLFHSFFNHKDLKKEFTEAWSIYRQIKAVLPSLATVGASADNVVLFDVCCGKGFASVLLAHKFPKMTDNKINVKHSGALPNVKVEHLDILKPSGHNNHASLTKLVFSALSGNRFGILAGMHLCGPLSEKFIECFRLIQRIRAMVLCPCCLKSHKTSTVASQAKSQNKDNYELWANVLFESIPSDGISKTLVKDDELLSVKNRIIVCSKTSELLPQDSPPDQPHTLTVLEKRIMTNAATNPEMKGIALQFANSFTWLPIRDCPGRYTLSSDQYKDMPAGFVNFVPGSAGSLTHLTVHKSVKAKDDILVVPFEDNSGGLISFRHSDGTHLHTLCVPSGFERKLRQLGIWDSLSH